MELSSDSIIPIAKQVFHDEIIGLKQVSESISADFVTAVTMILECKGKIIVSGMGKSGHIGNKIAATLASTGTPAFFMHPAEALHGDLGMVDANDLLIAISYSGESDELSSILPIIRRKKIKVIGITGNPKSTLAILSDCILAVIIDKEACPLNLAPTTSTTATLVLGDALAVALLSLRKFKPEDFAMSHPGGSLGRKLLTRVADIMHTGEDLPLVKADSSLKEVFVEISKKGFGIAAVVDENNILIGLISYADLRKAFDSEGDIRLLTALDFMNPDPKIMYANNMAVDALELIDKYKIRALLVVDDSKKVVGAFHMHDLFKSKLI